MDDDYDEHEIDEVIDEIFEIELTTRQINFLRLALKEYIRDELNGKISVAARKLSIGAETLRRFVKNINDENPDEDFYSSPKTHETITRKLAHPDIGALKLNDLIAGKKQHFDEAKHLSQFFSGEEINFDVKYAGKFEQALILKRQSKHLRKITLSPIPNESFFDVTEEVKRVSLETTVSSDDYESPSDKSLGWAVFIRDDLLLILLRDDIYQECHSYVSITNPRRSEASGAVEKLILVEHKDLIPMDWTKATTLSNDILQTKLTKNIHEFQRIEDFSGN